MHAPFSPSSLVDPFCFRERVAPGHGCSSLTMEQGLYDALHLFVRTGTFPKGLTKYEKDCTRRKAKNFVVKNGLLYFREKKKNVDLQVILLSWIASCEMCQEWLRRKFKKKRKEIKEEHQRKKLTMTKGHSVKCTYATDRSHLLPGLSSLLSVCVHDQILSCNSRPRLWESDHL